MNKKLLIPFVIAFFSFSAAFAQEVWFEEDFSSDTWQSAFSDKLLDTSQNPLPGLPGPGENRGFPTGEEFNGFKFDGALVQVSVAESSLPCVDNPNDYHTYAFRLRSSGTSYIEFPTQENAGTIYIHTRCGNATNTGSFYLDKKNSLDAWENLQSFTVQPSNDLKDNDGNIVLDEVISYSFNISEPVTLRISRNNRFVSIYKIRLEKYTENSISSTFADNVNAYVSNKTAYISGGYTDLDLTLTDLSGRNIFQAKVNGNQVNLPENLQKGVYVLQLSGTDGKLTKKIIIE